MNNKVNVTKVSFIQYKREKHPKSYTPVILLSYASNRYFYYSMYTFKSRDRQNYPNRYWAQLIQSMMGAKPLFLLGSVNTKGLYNLAPFNNVLHISASPPVWGIQFRPTDIERHSLTNILETRVFTLNAVPIDLIPKAHQASAKYPANVSEFDALGIEPVCIESIAPCVLASPIKIELEFTERVMLGTTGVSLVMGEITAIYLDIKPSDDGFVSLNDSHIAGSQGLDGYFKPGELTRYPYAEV